MSGEQRLDNETIEVLLNQIEVSIKQCQDRMVTLSKAKQKLVNIANEKPQRKSPDKRLPKGLPKQLALNAFEKNRVMTISELTNNIRDDSGHILSGTTIRRAVKQLEDEGKLEKLSDGRFEIILSEKKDEDDGLPF